MAKKDAGQRLTATRRKGSRTRVPRTLFRCACRCDEKLEVLEGTDYLEMNGVFGHKEAWKRLLTPLLKVKDPTDFT